MNDASTKLLESTYLKIFVNLVERGCHLDFYSQISNIADIDKYHFNEYP